MTQFALMLRDDADKYAEISPEEMQQIIGRYTAWADKMKELGKLAGGRSSLMATVESCGETTEP